MKKVALVATSALLALVAGSCNDVNKQESPVSLVVSTDQKLHEIDLAGDPPGQTKCQGDLATIHLTNVTVRAPLSNPNPNVSGADLNQITIDRYQVSYQRIDGGHLVPATFVRSTGIVIGTGASSDGSSFLAFDPNALNQAPFAALLPQNGGVDPETGKPNIALSVTTTFFGQTLAGSKVSGSTQMSLNFCYACGGCF